MLKEFLVPAFWFIITYFVVLLVLAGRRLFAIKKGQYPLSYFKIYQKKIGDIFPEKAEQASRHYINLFELPMLFFFWIVLVIITSRISSSMINLAWAYVIIRNLHSIEHLTFNNVNRRFVFFFLSNIILMFAYFKLIVSFYGE
jgi:hypothetical protein